MSIPIFLRTGFAISTKTGKAANTMTEDEWEEFYNALSEQLKRASPGLPDLVADSVDEMKLANLFCWAAEFAGDRDRLLYPIDP